MVKLIGTGVLLMILVAGCAPDPLELREQEIRERRPGSDLKALTVTPADGWTVDDGTYTASEPAQLELIEESGPFTLGLSLLLDRQTAGRIVIDGKYAVDLPALSMGADSTRYSADGLRPDNWQDLELTYQPSGSGSPALLAALYLNGAIVYYLQPLVAELEGADPGTYLEVTAGSLGVENVRYSKRAGKSSEVDSEGNVALSLPLIQYDYYDIEGSPDRIMDFAALSPAKQGYISRFDLDAIKDKGSGYAVRFTAELDIPESGEYTFDMYTPASSRLYLDDRLVVDMAGPVANNRLTGSVELDRGVHNLRLEHYQNVGWNRLQLSYTAPGGYTASLNDMTSGRDIAMLPGGPSEIVETGERPYLLRSFLHFPPARIYDYVEKRTHVISVGEGGGPHYSYDLRNGALLQAWRGGFVDAGLLWIGRGEPQVVRPLGPVLALGGRPTWSTDLEQWPDSLLGVRHDRYELDAAGRPTFYFAGDDGEYGDRIVPTAEGLDRTVSNAGGSEAVYVELASARRIDETAPGSFDLRGPGASVMVTELAAGGLHLLHGQNFDRLVAELPAGERVTYSLNW